MDCKQFIMRYLILIFAIIFFSCNREKNNERPVVKHSKQTLQDVNKLLVEKDAELIASFVDRRGWEMQTTESGLWYMIYKDGSGSSSKGLWLRS